jgi:hypothetical protein
MITKFKLLHVLTEAPDPWIGQVSQASKDLETEDGNLIPQGEIVKVRQIEQNVGVLVVYKQNKKPKEAWVKFDQFKTGVCSLPGKLEPWPC